VPYGDLIKTRKIKICLCFISKNFFYCCLYETIRDSGDGWPVPNRSKTNNDLKPYDVDYREQIEKKRLVERQTTYSIVH